MVSVLFSSKKSSYFLIDPSVLWTVTILTLNRTLENLRTMQALNFTNFLCDRVMGRSMESPSYCCFRKAVSNNFFQKILLINYIGTYANLLQHFIFARFLLIENYGKCAHWSQFKTVIFQKSY